MWGGGRHYGVSDTIGLGGCGRVDQAAEGTQMRLWLLCLNLNFRGVIPRLARPLLAPKFRWRAGGGGYGFRHATGIYLIVFSFVSREPCGLVHGRKLFYIL